MITARPVDAAAGGFFFPPVDLQPHIEKFAARMAEVEQELGDPKVFENNRRAQELGREYARLKNLVALGERLLKAKDELEENRALAAGDDAEMAEMAAEEIPPLEEEIPRLEKEVQFGLVPPDSTDSRNTIVEIRAGAGGEEGARGKRAQGQSKAAEQDLTGRPGENRPTDE